MLGWAENWKVELVHIQPGRPMQNGHVESFHGRVRDECLNANWFSASSTQIRTASTTTAARDNLKAKSELGNSSSVRPIRDMVS
jgi:putative transposase